jgi:hypothetical protein
MVYLLPPPTPLRLLQPLLILNQHPRHPLALPPRLLLLHTPPPRLPLCPLPVTTLCIHGQHLCLLPPPLLPSDR